MIVTEKQAEGKLCQEEAGHPDTNLTKCQASECMAWRWIDPDEYQNATGKLPPDLRLGYCGKARRPDLMKGEPC